MRRLWGSKTSAEDANSGTKPVKANMGKKLSMYYNTELGRWVHPGDEEKIRNEQKEKLAPPPALSGGPLSPLPSNAKQGGLPPWLRQNAAPPAQGEESHRRAQSFQPYHHAPLDTGIPSQSHAEMPPMPPLPSRGRVAVSPPLGPRPPQSVPNKPPQLSPPPMAGSEQASEFSPLNRPSNATSGAPPMPAGAQTGAPSMPPGASSLPSGTSSMPTSTPPMSSHAHPLHTSGFSMSTGAPGGLFTGASMPSGSFSLSAGGSVVPSGPPPLPPSTHESSAPMPQNPHGSETVEPPVPAMPPMPPQSHGDVLTRGATPLLGAVPPISRMTVGSPGLQAVSRQSRAASSYQLREATSDAPPVVVMRRNSRSRIQYRSPVISRRGTLKSEAGDLESPGSLQPGRLQQPVVTFDRVAFRSKYSNTVQTLDEVLCSLLEIYSPEIHKIKSKASVDKALELLGRVKMLTPSKAAKKAEQMEQTLSVEASNAESRPTSSPTLSDSTTVSEIEAVVKTLEEQYKRERGHLEELVDEVERVLKQLRIELDYCDYCAPDDKEEYLQREGKKALDAISKNFEELRSLFEEIECLSGSLLGQRRIVEENFQVTVLQLGREVDDYLNDVFLPGAKKIVEAKVKAIRAELGDSSEKLDWREEELRRREIELAEREARVQEQIVKVEEKERAISQAEASMDAKREDLEKGYAKLLVAQEKLESDKKRVIAVAKGLHVKKRPNPLAEVKLTHAPADPSTASSVPADSVFETC
eukprot:Blabericola_migrator_1__3408@NODE_1_length_33786_cov_123_788665_g0_i0_p3_GENE_NODE_1_length_33786_cov_123_788665_g0_i0NODE_1_length_33786_cov_123_788665_g0_i0_p3_ORF_typecomplete_len754_score89_19DUF3552/PF12072_8/1_2e03DUF3552/PF12072_8/0_0033PV1/PF06637_11/0_22DUF4795/PF16043_5/0_027DUF4795/PF16043_5/1_4e02HemX/PF04375_14/20HemX/PF04375_14/1_7Filament/PF00038_21/6_6Filament/PF00038_21/67DUF16/PF01519_16/4_6DUF16/PF01519_16/21Nup88/PF10168_9/59Nup88/PF10168_9/3_2Atg14/PF10186_9/18Atg14/PF10186_